MPFSCPDCGAISYHPEDIRNLYCGRCHEFKGEPYEVEVDLLSEVPDPELLVGLEVNVTKKSDGRVRVSPVIPDSPGAHTGCGECGQPTARPGVEHKPDCSRR